MRFEIKNPELFISNIRHLCQFMSHARISFFKENITIAGMNEENTLLLVFEVDKTALCDYRWAESPDYIINLFAAVFALANMPSEGTVCFEGDWLVITSEKGTQSIPVLRLEERAKLEDLSFKARFDLSRLIPLFKNYTIKSKEIYPIQIEGSVGSGMKLSCIVAPVELPKQEKGTFSR